MTVRGFTYHDLVRGFTYHDLVRGFNYHDLLRGFNYHDLLRGFNYHDLVRGFTYHDLLRGFTYHDLVRGFNYHDLLRGFNYHDLLRGFNYHDLLRGFNYHDLLRGFNYHDLGGGGTILNQKVLYLFSTTRCTRELSQFFLVLPMSILRASYVHPSCLLCPSFVPPMSILRASYVHPSCLLCPSFVPPMSILQPSLVSILQPHVHHPSAPYVQPPAPCPSLPCPSMSILRASYVHPSCLLCPSFVPPMSILRASYVHPSCLLCPSFVPPMSILRASYVHPSCLLCPSFVPPMSILRASYVHPSCLLCPSSALCPSLCPPMSTPSVPHVHPVPLVSIPQPYATMSIPLRPVHPSASMSILCPCPSFSPMSILLCLPCPSFSSMSIPVPMSILRASYVHPSCLLCPSFVPPISGGEVKSKIASDIKSRIADNVKSRIERSQAAGVRTVRFKRHVPGYPRYRYLGDASKGQHYLIIKGVTLEDDGEYQCQVGPTLTSLPIWTAANVTVMVSPTSISVVGVGDGEVVEVVAGDALYLECLVTDARPPPTVTWYRDAIALHQGMHQEVVVASKEPRKWSVRSRLLLHPEAEDDGQQYSCQALHPVLHHSPTTLVASVNLAVLHPPGPPVITGYVTGEVLVEGQQRTLICQVVGGRPRPWVTWYRHGRPLNLALTHLMKTPELETTTTTTPITTKGVSARQIVTAARAEDGAVYECRVSNPPVQVTVTGPTVVVTDQVFTLTCTTSPANPPASLTWRLQGSSVSSTGAAVVRKDSGGGWVTSSQLTHHLSSSPEATAQCLASHSAAHHALTGTHNLTVISDQLSVVCTSRGGNPPPALTLYKAGKKVTATVKGVEEGVTEGRAVLHLTPSDNGQEVTCQVSSPATSTPMTAHTTINLHFAAWKVSGWVNPPRVSEGQVATLTCETTSSVPPSTITWHSQMTLVQTTAEDNGQIFTCEADNGLGVIVATNITLNVTYGPVWLWAPSGVVDVEEGQDLTLTALASANPGSVRCFTVHARIVKNFSQTEKKAINVNGDLGIWVLSTDGPEDVLAAERVVVDEDGTATILCTAAGNPLPKITWTRASDNTSTVRVLATGIGEAEMVVDSATQHHTGIYLCHASSVVSSPPPVTTAIVVTQAPVVATGNTEEEEQERGSSRAAVGDSGWLDCRMRASPPPTFRWTSSSSGQVLSNTKKYSIHVPQLVDKVMEWSSLLEIRSVTVLDYTNYSCTAHNSRGSYTTTFTLRPPIIPSAPTILNVTSVSSTTAVVMWTNNILGAQATGFTIRYQQTGTYIYKPVDVPGSDSVTSTLKGLLPGAEYSFTISAYNENGHSNYSSPPITVTMLDVMKEVSSSSTVGGHQPRLPRLILLLISLTGTALLVLNISIIVCFVRRRAIKLNISGKSELGGLVSDSLEHQTIVDNCEQTSRVMPYVTSEPSEPLPTPPLSRGSRSRSTSPLLNGGINLNSNRILLDKGELPPEKLFAPGSPSKSDKQILRERSPSAHSSNNPDVCPTASSSHHPSLPKQEPHQPTSETEQASLSSEESSDSDDFSPRQLPSSCQTSRPATQVIYHGQPHLQLQLEQEQHHHYPHTLPYSQQQLQSSNYSQPHRQELSFHSSLNPAQLSTSTSSCCDANCRQSIATDIPVGYATLQPRRSCLKRSPYNTLQRSHSAHNYTSNSLRCINHDPCMEMQTAICCQNDLCSKTLFQTPQPHRVVYGRAHEFPIYYARSSTIGRGCSRHNSISEQVGYWGISYQEPNWTSVTPDICKVESSSTKRVGWKEVLHESPGPSTMASRGSIDTSTSSTTSTVTLGPTRFPQHCDVQNNLGNSSQIVDMDD
ncbi:Nephrin-like 25 [Homarus americanus]|uniref:Nephrin-like 25 n=1 Tax=Homarus americanus TaxID=6706 RepID=A0A8J5JIZ5_HOMAM|nr:Nephrin-like 25 [Homarus americanus]